MVVQYMRRQWWCNFYAGNGGAIYTQVMYISCFFFIFRFLHFCFVFCIFVWFLHFVFFAFLDVFFVFFVFYNLGCSFICNIVFPPPRGRLVEKIGQHRPPKNEKQNKTLEINYVCNMFKT